MVRFSRIDATFSASKIYVTFQARININVLNIDL